MTKVTDNQIIGNRGEAFVNFLLSKYCLTRSVTNGTDVGIDIYCETIDQNLPHSHFWVQVKSSGNDKKKSYNFHRRHLEYWDRQPIPVFVFLISFENETSLENYEIDVINITEKFIDGLKLEKNSKTLEVDSKISDDTELKNFLFNQIPVTIARQKLKDGIISPVMPKVKEEYLKKVFPNGSHKFTKKILTTIGRTSGYVIKDILENSDNNTTIKGQRHHFERILETFSEWGKWDMQYNLGLSQLADGKYEEAKSSFIRSLGIIDRDKSLDGSAKVELKQIVENQLCQLSKDRDSH